MSAIGNILSTAGTDPTSTNKSDSKKDLFLQLLVAEMRTQNPLEPMDNQSFMEQMSQFSAMEQTQEMNQNLAQLIRLQLLLATSQGLEQASALLGKVVDFTTSDGSEGSGSGGRGFGGSRNDGAAAIPGPG